MKVLVTDLHRLLLHFLMNQLIQRQCLPVSQSSVGLDSRLPQNQDLEYPVRGPCPTETASELLASAHRPPAESNLCPHGRPLRAVALAEQLHHFPNGSLNAIIL